MRDNLEEMTERARLAAESARAAADAARQAADQLAEATRATVAAARDTWQQGSQQPAQQPPAEQATSAGEAATEAESGTIETSEGGDIAPQSSTKPGETTPEASQSVWPPDRPLPQTDAQPDESGTTSPGGLGG
jgi:hypothetical protein